MRFAVKKWKLFDISKARSNIYNENDIPNINHVYM